MKHNDFSDHTYKKKKFNSKYSLSYASSPKNRIKKIEPPLSPARNYVIKYEQMFKENNEEQETMDELFKENYLLRT